MIAWLMTFFSALSLHLPHATTTAPKIAPTHLDVRIAFGYKDARPARFVGDRYERMYVIQKLLKPCEQPQDEACGFIRDAEDANLFHRELVQDLKVWQLDLRLTASSAGADDEDNRRNPYQRQLSWNSQNNFLYGLQNADAVFYVGHSRVGGGPDFKPPKLRADQDVNYAWYKVHQPGLKMLLAGLKKKPRAMCLGLFSCSSNQHFAESIHRASPEVKAFLTPKAVYYTEALSEVLEELSKFIVGLRKS